MSRDSLTDFLFLAALVVLWVVLLAFGWQRFGPARPPARDARSGRLAARRMLLIGLVALAAIAGTLLYAAR